VIGEGFAEVLIVIPADAGAPPLHQADAAENEAPRANADEGRAGRGQLAQIARGDLIDLGSGMQDAADHDQIVQFAPRQEAAGRLDHHVAAGADGFGAVGHDRPGDMQWPAAIAFIGRQAQVINEHRERGQREVIGEDDSDAQRGLA